jgi:hypothetical protein
MTLHLGNQSAVEHLRDHHEPLLAVFGDGLYDGPTRTALRA